MKEKSLITCLVLQLSAIIYSLSVVFSKVASFYDFLSFHFFINFLFLMFFTAILYLSSSISTVSMCSTFVLVAIEIEPYPIAVPISKTVLQFSLLIVSHKKHKVSSNVIGTLCDLPYSLIELSISILFIALNNANNLAR